MERRNFLKLAFGAAAGAAAFTAAAQAAPLAPQPLGDPRMPQGNSGGNPDAHPAVTTSEEAAQLKPEQVRWGHGHGHWHRRHWGWRRRRWHRRHW